MTRTVAAALAAVWIAFPGFCIAETLDSFPLRKDFAAARSSSYDRGGGNYDMRGIDPGQSLVIADLDGPGAVTHLWFTFMYPGTGAGFRNLVVRAWFDGAETPCVEAPLGLFFGIAHEQSYAYASQPLAVATHNGLNSYWRMPFARHARLTVTNEGRVRCQALYFYVDYQRLEKPEPGALCFHAQYRQAMPCRQGEPYVLLDARGDGHYAGCVLGVEQREDGWWGEGDDRFFVDGETTPSIVGTGSEDYFGGAWCYKEEFAFPYIGMPLRGRLDEKGRLQRCVPWLAEEQAAEWNWPKAWRKGDLWTVYRFHLPDPVVFRKSLRAEIEHGHQNSERVDAFSSVAYWYQSEPHGPQPALAAPAERKPFVRRPQEREGGLFELEDFVDATTWTQGRAVDSDMGFWKGGASWVGVMEWSGQKPGATLTVPFEVAKGGRFSAELQAFRTSASGVYDVVLDGAVVASATDFFEKSVFPAKHSVALGSRELTTGTHTLEFRCKGKAAESKDHSLLVDYLKLGGE